MASAMEHEPRDAHQTKKGDRECAGFIIRREVNEGTHRAASRPPNSIKSLGPGLARFRARSPRRNKIVA